MKIPQSLVSEFDRRETSRVELVPGVTFELCEYNATNPLWARRAAEFIKNHPDHPAAANSGEFFKTLREKLTDKNVVDFLADVLIIDWDGVDLDPYSPENARELLTKLPRLTDQILMSASTASNFRNAEVENAVKNS